MAKKCNLCKRSSTKGTIRSHSNIKTLKRQNINLQTKKVEGATLILCTKCIKTLSKTTK